VVRLPCPGEHTAARRLRQPTCGAIEVEQLICFALDVGARLIELRPDDEHDEREEHRVNRTQCLVAHHVVASFEHLERDDLAGDQQSGH
jgi:hypothetical protein